MLPDYFCSRPKACTGGWGRRHLVVTPDGRALPCHGAAELPLEFWNVREHGLAACWSEAPGMNAFRGESWMQEPCRSCPERKTDFGGCRCQAFALLGGIFSVPEDVLQRRIDEYDAILDLKPLLGIPVRELSLGQRMMSLETALEIVDVWMDTEFEGGRHENRIKQLDA